MRGRGFPRGLKIRVCSEEPKSKFIQLSESGTLVVLTEPVDLLQAPRKAEGYKPLHSALNDCFPIGRLSIGVLSENNLLFSDAFYK